MLHHFAPCAAHAHADVWRQHLKGSVGLLFTSRSHTDVVE
jgi:hypothetical protein